MNTMNTSITDLYIIGNGFDLHHGINSSYFEYRIWLKKHYEDIYWWRKRSIPTHLERHNPPTIIAKMGLKRA